MSTVSDIYLLHPWAKAISYSHSFTGVKFHLPTLTKSMGFSSTDAQLLSVPPYILACVGCIVIPRLSDRYRQRGYCMFSVCRCPHLFSSRPTSLCERHEEEHGRPELIHHSLCSHHRLLRCHDYWMGCRDVSPRQLLRTETRHRLHFHLLQRRRQLCNLSTDHSMGQ